MWWTRSAAGAVVRVEDRARIEDAVGVERVLDPAGQRHDVVTEIGGQPGLLRLADTVFTGDRSAEVEREIHDLAERGVRPRRGRRVGAVVHDQRVGIAVPRMGDERDRDLLLDRDLLDAPHQRGELGQGDADVFEQQVAEALQRGERGPPGSSERITLARIVGAEDLARAAVQRGPLHEPDLVRRRFPRARRNGR